MRVVECDERGPDVWCITEPACHGRTQIQEPSPQGWGLDARLITLLYKKNIVWKSKEVETGRNLAKSSKAENRLF
jgi:hypothetical protein